MEHTVVMTTKFLVSPRSGNLLKTFLKSMGLGATKKSPPNADRWLQRQRMLPETTSEVTYENKEKESILTIKNA